MTWWAIDIEVCIVELRKDKNKGKLWCQVWCRVLVKLYTINNKDWNDCNILNWFTNHLFNFSHRCIKLGKYNNTRLEWVGATNGGTDRDGNGAY